MTEHVRVSLSRETKSSMQGNAAGLGCHKCASLVQTKSMFVQAWNAGGNLEKAAFPRSSQLQQQPPFFGTAANVAELASDGLYPASVML